MAFDVGDKGSVKSDINVVPLVDIVLVLLIIFIVITPAVSNAVTLPLSKYSEKQEVDHSAKYLTLILTRDMDPKTNKDDLGRYKMKNVLVDDADAKDAAGNPLVFGFENKQHRDNLIDFVKQNVDKLRGDKRVFIKADAELPFEYVYELFQICREAGANEASVVTSEDKAKPNNPEQGAS
jgi:biopolymer transport protein ExbD/biopolymer transport protein TolR